MTLEKPLVQRLADNDRKIIVNVVVLDPVKEFQSNLINIFYNQPWTDRFWNSKVKVTVDICGNAFLFISTCHWRFCNVGRNEIKWVIKRKHPWQSSALASSTLLLHDVTTHVVKMLDATLSFPCRTVVLYVYSENKVR